MKHTPHTDTRGGVRTALLLAALTACVGLLPAFAPPAAAQTQVVTPPAQQLAFDRPESWALAHFTAATLLSGLETPATRDPGAVSFAFEVGWLPPLTTAQQLVGFNGTEAQDLNKAPILPRFWLSVGLPARFSVILAAVPPITMFGLKSALVDIALERPLVETERWTFGLRGYGQFGWVRGAYTCPPSVVAFEPGSAENMSGCDAPSSDTASLHYIGGEASVAYRPSASSRLSPHAAFGVSYMDVGFQVDALTFGFPDHTHYLSSGTAVSASGGVSYRVASRFTVGLDLFYSPQTVRRSLGAPLETDGLFNVRALVTYRLR